MLIELTCKLFVAEIRLFAQESGIFLPLVGATSNMERFRARSEVLL